jgi:hypothetical protein
MIRVFEIFKRFGRMFYKFVCSTFWGLGLMEERKNGGVGQIAQLYQKERECERKAKAKENGWVVFKHSYSPLH